MELEVKHLEDEIREHIEIFYEGQGFLGNLSSQLPDPKGSGL
jgi:hypothetical protein